MLPFASQPLAHCSATRIRSRVGFGSRSKLPTPKNVPPKPASSSSRFVAVTTTSPASDGGDGRGRLPLRATRVRARARRGWRRCRSGTSPVRPRSRSTRLRGVICHVTRPLAFSNVRSEYCDAVEVRRIQPLGGIAGVQVVVDVRAVPGAAAGVRVDEVPRAIRSDRPAERAGDIVDPRERSRGARRPDPSSACVRLSDCSRRPVPLANTDPCIVLPPELRHDVHHESGGLDFAQRARRHERDFLRLADVHDVAGRRIADRRTPDIQSVEKEAPLVLPAAVHRERRGRRDR